MRRVFTLKLTGVSPYSQSRHYDVNEVPKLDKEGNEAYDMRTWRNRMHVNAAGEVYIPPMALKNCLAEAAKYLSMQIPGKGKSTYTKHFEAGILVVDPMLLGIDASSVTCEALFVPADGRRGSGKRVVRRFPFIPEGWTSEATIHVLDATITREVLEAHLREAGSLIGMGRFRPRNNGFYGRFRAEIIGEETFE
jgi:hypothetical protein